MNRIARGSIASVRLVAVCLAAWALAGPASAQNDDTANRLARLEALVAQQQRQLEAQAELLARLQSDPVAIEDRWRVSTDPELAIASARGVVPQSAPGDAPQPRTVAAAPAGPPLPAQNRSELAAIPEGLAVLSRAGRLSLDLSTDYTRSTANRLVFRGIEIVPGIQIGVIEANEVDRDTIGFNLTTRYGLTDRLEFEARIPYVDRHDTITTVQQRDEAVTRTIDLEGGGIGDVEAAVRYQFTRGERGGPIYIGALRIKSDTGEGPFDIDRDEFGVATRLATGSGFWGVEPSVTMLYPSDPAVIFANLSYFAHLPRDVNVIEGGVTVGEVDPGDAIGATIGFGFALNRQFSFSLGYRHNYIFPTESQLNDIVEKSDELQVGALLFGMTYRFDERFSLNGNFEFGVTGDAPDMRFILRIPFVF